jgi:glycosyltransferase involved in cell wall biosynthesis
MPQISLVTAVFNGADALASCLQSVDRQSYKSFEHIIVDAKSTDSTLDVIEKHSRDYRHLISEKDSGVYDGTNKGIKSAKGDIVGILNADDFYASPNVLAEVTRAFGDKSVHACYGDLCYVDCYDTDKVVRYWRSNTYHYQKFYWGWMPPHPTFFVRRSAYEKFGYFNLNLGSAADYELMLRFLIRHRLKTVYIPEVLVKMRTGGVSNSTVTNRLRANKMDRMAWSVNGLRPYPWTLTMKPLRKIRQWFVMPPEIKD